MFDIKCFYETQLKIKGYVRRTPLIVASCLKNHPAGINHLSIKIESLQVTGSFKPRGAINAALSLPSESKGIVTASGGNHGLAVAYVGWLLKIPATIYIPHNTPLSKVKKLMAWGAEAISEGTVWDEANLAALDTSKREGSIYIHPFADPAIIKGQGTISLEIISDAPETDVIVVAIGGGGLISGISLAAKLLKPSIRIIGVEPVGAPTLYESLKSGRIIDLPEITTVAGTLAAKRSTDLNLEIIKKNVEKVVLVSDEEMRQAAKWLWFEMGIGAELSGAAATAALLCGKIDVHPSEHICALVCGAGTDGIAS